MPLILALTPRRYLHAPTPKIRPFQSGTQGCLVEDPFLLSHHISSHTVPRQRLGMCLGQLNVVRGRRCLKYLQRA